MRHTYRLLFDQAAEYVPGKVLKKKKLSKRTYFTEEMTTLSQLLGSLDLLLAQF